MSYRVQVSDLLQKPGAVRDEKGAISVSVRLADAVVDDDVTLEVTLRSLADGLILRGHVTAPMDMRCASCLMEWSEPIDIPLEAVFRAVPQDADGELPIEIGGWVDLEPVVHDEVALALPVAPKCRPVCRGLCPTCGTDLNTDPCDGHDDKVVSPFAALLDLFDDDEDDTGPVTGDRPETSSETWSTEGRLMRHEPIEDQRSEHQ